MAKKHKLEEEEKSLGDELKYDETVLEGIEERAERSTSVTEMKSSIAAAKVLWDKIKMKRAELAKITEGKVKLLELKLKH